MTVAYGPTESDSPNAAAGASKLLYSIAESAEMLGLGRTKLCELIYAGVIESVKVGGRRLIPAAFLEDYVERLCAESRGAPADGRLRLVDR